MTTVIAGGMQTPFILDRFPETPLDLLQDPRNVALAIRFVLDMPPETVDLRRSPCFPSARPRGRERAARSPGPVVFLDKDGTVIEDVPYNVDPRRIRLAPGAREAIRLLGQADATLVIATNQSGVARGYFSEDDLHAVGRHLGDVFAGLGARLAGFYFCPHVEPGDGVNAYAVICDCRKPEPGLVTAACRDLGLSLERRLVRR